MLVINFLVLALLFIFCDLCRTDLEFRAYNSIIRNNSVWNLLFLFSSFSWFWGHIQWCLLSLLLNLIIINYSCDAWGKHLRSRGSKMCWPMQGKPTILFLGPVSKNFIVLYHLKIPLCTWIFSLCKTPLSLH